MHGSKWYWVVLVFVKIGDMYKFVTGGKNVSKSEQSGDLNDQNVGNSDFDGWDDDDGIMGLIPETVSDTDNDVEQRSVKNVSKISRNTNSRTKPCGRGKRTR